MSVFSKIGGFFKKIFGFVVKSDPFKKLIEELLPVAISYVTYLSKLENLTNEQRREQAVAYLAATAKQKGLAFADHMLRFIVEAAVAKMKGTVAFE